tara:strand:- start:376 stop:1035 length:660 start_codon:yes stop_codon:yes gene_type:complete
MKNYLETFYNFEKKPVSSYPEHFVSYNFNRFNLNNTKLLEIGCGRGDFINRFAERNLDCYATDVLLGVEKYLNKKVSFSQNDISKNQLPYDDDFFDAIYTKSVIEHLDNHEIFFNECKRVLKKGGKLIIYTPDWETQYLHFYDDLTHVKPFTKRSLESCFKLFGFRNFEIEEFYQLPIIWKFPTLKYLAKVIAIFVPIRSKIKIFRFSKELMLLGYAIK